MGQWVEGEKEVKRIVVDYLLKVKVVKQSAIIAHLIKTH